MEKPQKRPAWMREVVTAGNDLHAMKKDPLWHNIINGISTFVLVLVSILTMMLSAALPPLLYIPIAGVIFGVVYFSVNVLVIHECSHNMFVLSADRERSKRLNRAVGVFAGWLFFTDYLRHWEKGHTVHHLRPCEADDPQDRYPITGWELYKRLLILALIPLSFVAFNPSKQYPGQLKRAAIGLAVWAPIVALTWVTFGWVVPAALVVGFQVVSILNYLKKAQEHGGGLANEPDRLLRSRTYFYPVAVIFSPFNINYHFEHHANFSVPWYSLPAYHKKAREIVPEALRPYYFHHQYLMQLAGQKPLPPANLRPLMGEGPEVGAPKREEDYEAEDALGGVPVTA